MPKYANRTDPYAYYLELLGKADAARRAGQHGMRMYWRMQAIKEGRHMEANSIRWDKERAPDWRSLLMDGEVGC